MRNVAVVLLAASLAACASSSKAPASKEPAEQRIARSMRLYERMIVALEPADADDCEAMAGRLRAFSETDDAEAIRSWKRDKEEAALTYVVAHQAELSRDYGPMRTRFLAIFEACGADTGFRLAMDESKLFRKHEVERERIAAGMVMFARMLTAIESSDRNCHALAGRIRAFAATDDAAVMRVFVHDETLIAFIETHAAEFDRAYAPLKQRLREVIGPCEGDEEVHLAFYNSDLITTR